jgi:formylglycine-generating enzyme required for sulfatase activity
VRQSLSVLLLPSLAAGFAGLLSCVLPAIEAQSPSTRYRESIAGTLVTFEMKLVHGGGDVAPFYLGVTEVTWDLYDVFALGLDRPAEAKGADAIARPSRPYGAPDQGWGHAGYPAISIAREAADEFTTWLSKTTGTPYRLPTEAEWERAAALAMNSETPPDVAAIAWHRGNASGRTRPVASLAPDALGLFDLFGNVAEWVAAPDGARVVRGGSYRDPIARLGPNARAIQDDSWNERDPQLPKSRWWLSDGPFVGLRLASDGPQARRQP